MDRQNQVLVPLRNGGGGGAGHHGHHLATTTTTTMASSSTAEAAAGGAVPCAGCDGIAGDYLQPPNRSARCSRCSGGLPLCFVCLSLAATCVNSASHVAPADELALADKITCSSCHAVVCSSPGCSVRCTDKSCEVCCPPLSLSLCFSMNL